MGFTSIIVSSVSYIKEVSIIQQGLNKIRLVKPFFESKEERCLEEMAVNTNKPLPISNVFHWDSVYWWEVEKITAEQNLHLHVHCTITHNNQQVGATQMSSDGWRHAQNVTHTYSGISFGLQKKHSLQNFFMLEEHATT